VLTWNRQVGRNRLALVGEREGGEAEAIEGNALGAYVGIGRQSEGDDTGRREIGHGSNERIVCRQDRDPVGV
jgi:hypothetical protein